MKTFRIHNFERKDPGQVIPDLIAPAFHLPRDGNDFDIVPFLKVTFWQFINSFWQNILCFVYRTGNFRSSDNSFSLSNRISNRISRMNWLVERKGRFSILKMSGFLVVLFFVLACACSESFALERALFVDSTDGGYFYSLFEFLERFFDEVEFKKDFHFSSGEANLPQDFDLVFWGYQRESLLFFQVLIPGSYQKVLSMVRPLSEKEKMLETLRHRIVRLLDFHRSFKVLFLRNEDGCFSVVVRDLKNGKEREIKVDSLKHLEDMSISRDGRFVFLVHRRGGYREIWRLDLEKGSLLPLSCGGYNDFSPYPLGESGRLVFLSDRNGEDEILSWSRMEHYRENFLKS